MHLMMLKIFIIGATLAFYLVLNAYFRYAFPHMLGIRFDFYCVNVLLNIMNFLSWHCRTAWDTF